MLTRSFGVACIKSLLCLLALTSALAASGQEKRKIIIDQDASGPAGTDSNSMVVFLQAPNVEVLGITTVMGDQWVDEETVHTLRLLELMGRTDIPVVKGIDHPFIRTKDSTKVWEQTYGKVLYQGAWSNASSKYAPDVVPPLREGNPTTKPLDEDAAHFLIRMVHKYPHQVAIYAGGPLMNIAAAMNEDSQFAELAGELVIMGGSINPQTDDPEYIDSQRREFNFWIDPEAASIVFHGKWAKVTVTTVDVSIETHLTAEMLDELGKSKENAAQYIACYNRRPPPNSTRGYLWDELAAAAWLDPTLITGGRNLYMDVSIDHGLSYGDTMIWSESDKPAISEGTITYTQLHVDWPKFRDMFMKMMMSPTPNAKNPQMVSCAH